MIAGRYLRESHRAEPTQGNQMEELMGSVELQYIESLKQHLQHILETAQKEESAQNRASQQLIMSLKEENEDLTHKYEEMTQKCEELILQNSHLKSNWSRFSNAVKLLERKEGLLNNKIAQQNHIIIEKEAIIKYLQQKQEAKTRRSVNKSSRDSQSCISTSNSKVFIPSLALDRLSKPTTVQDSKFNDFMPPTTRSINTTDSFTQQNYVYQERKGLNYSKDTNESILPSKRNNLNMERSFQTCKYLNRNESSLLLNHYGKAYDYNLWKHVNQREHYRTDASYSFSHYNRSTILPLKSDARK